MKPSTTELPQKANNFENLNMQVQFLKWLLVHIKPSLKSSQKVIHLNLSTPTTKIQHLIILCC